MLRSTQHDSFTSIVSLAAAAAFSFLKPSNNINNNNNNINNHKQQSSELLGTHCAAYLRDLCELFFF